MAGDVKGEIERQGFEHWQKYDYFLMAAAMAAIALSLQRTEGLPLRWPMLPLGVAVLLWGVSIYCGIRSQLFRGYALADKWQMQLLKDGTHPEYMNATEQKRQQRHQAHMEKHAQHAAVVDKATRWQRIALMAGGILFLIWHVLEMALQTPGLLAWATYQP
jgi:hypothetical protein